MKQTLMKDWSNVKMGIILSRNEAQFDHLLKQHQTFWRIKWKKEKEGAGMVPP
jgi:hypothetical protein